MFALARADRPAIFVTVLGEPPLKMSRYQQQFEFFDVAKANASAPSVAGIGRSTGPADGSPPMSPFRAP